MSEKLLSDVLLAIAELREEMKQGFQEMRQGFRQTESELAKIHQRLDSIEADIAVLVQESHANKKAIHQLRKTAQPQQEQ